MLRRGKYNAKRTEVDGVVFDSQKEARRYSQLKLMERAGEIEDLELQPRFDFVLNGYKIGFYKADFRYVRKSDGVPVIEDVKGYKTDVYRLKKRMVAAFFGREITEV